MRNKFYARAWRILRPIVLFFLPVELRGTENLEDEAAILCANHSSAWDPVLIVCALADDVPLRIMAKQQLFRIPVVGGFIRYMGAFPVDRGNSDIGAIKTAIKSLKDGFSLLIFPEGTRVKKGQHVEPKGGATMIAIRSGVKMLPVFISSTRRLFHKLSLIIGKPYAPVYTERKGTAEEYQQNVDEVMRQVYELGGAQ